MKIDRMTTRLLFAATLGVATALSAPAHAQCVPNEIGFVDVSGQGVDVAVSGGVAYVADALSGLRVFDVSDPSDPNEIGFLDTPGEPAGIVVSGGIAYVTDTTDGLRVIDVSDPTSPSELGFLDTPGGARGLAVAGGVAYVADGGSLRVIDVSDPANPSELGSVGGFNGAALDVAVSGGVAYVADGGLQFGTNSGLWTVDVSNPADPAQIAFVLFSLGAARGVAVSGDVAYLSANFITSGGLELFDVSDPANPSGLSALGWDGNSWGLAVVGDTAYTADVAGLRIIDVENPSCVSERGFFETPGSTNYGVFVVDDLAYVTGVPSGLRVIDLASCSDAPVCPEDLDGNGSVGFADLTQLLSKWGDCR